VIESDEQTTCKQINTKVSKNPDVTISMVLLVIQGTAQKIQRYKKLETSINPLLIQLMASLGNDTCLENWRKPNQLLSIRSDCASRHPNAFHHTSHTKIITQTNWQIIDGHIRLPPHN
jgi:hypothetical protein